MDNIILGLLFLANRTIYQLRDRIDKGMHLMFSSSMGSIQAAIKKLLCNGYIDFDEVIENGKYKKIYRITDAGRQSFMQWVNGPMDAQSPKLPNLAKVYFMGFAQKESREKSLREHISFLKQQHALLDTVCAEASSMHVPQEFNDIFHYQYICAVYGRDMIQFNINWFEKLLEEIRSEKA